MERRRGFHTPVQKKLKKEVHKDCSFKSIGSLINGLQVHCWSIKISLKVSVSVKLEGV